MFQCLECTLTYAGEGPICAQCKQAIIEHVRETPQVHTATGVIPNFGNVAYDPNTRGFTFVYGEPLNDET